ncbi:hypothetical protein ES705_39966 [subsurface metagenome]
MPAHVEMWSSEQISQAVPCLVTVSGSVIVVVGVGFCSGGASFAVWEAGRLAANRSSALVLSRGGNKTLSIGTRLIMLPITVNQAILPFYHLLLLNQISSGGPSGGIGE